MATILITGGTGLIGSALTRLLLDRGYRVIILTRRKGDEGGSQTGDSGGGVPRGPEWARWDPETGFIDPEAIRRTDHIIHLAGAGVADRRWSKARKRVIVESRTKSSALVAKALKEIPNNVQAVISASAIGWYGPDPVVPNPQPFEESAPADDDFLGETCRLWEEAIHPVEEAGKRLVIIRTGIVLSGKGGALAEFRKPVRLGVAAILGSGRQVISWIHVDDLCRLYVAAIEQKEWRGVFNGVAPQPVDNRTLVLTLGRRLKGRYFVPVYVPSFFLKLALGEMSIEVLKSTTVSARRAREAGFQFIYPSIDSALDDLL
ncbi:MAG: TIGR01777 family oxidoreductase [Bacteroidetes bacterium]|nr:TIGR01777 family oxidoreductase [Bacteroidota bacterium]